MANSGTNNGAITVTDAATSRTNLGLGAAALLTAPVSVSDGGTGNTSSTNGGIWVGNGTGAIQEIAGSSAAQFFIAATGAAPAWAVPTNSDGSITITPVANGQLTLVATLSSTTQLGATELATQTEVNTGTDTALYVTPQTLTGRFAVPGAIGGTTPAQGTFTNVVLTTTSGPQINTGSGAPSASTPKGTLYMRTDGSTTNDRAYTNSNGTTTYTAFVTVA